MSGAPFALIAHLTQGASFDTRFGVGLDALLASRIRAQKKSEQGLSGVELDGGLRQNQVAIIDLPLDRCTLDNDAWHWECTNAMLIGDAGMNTNFHLQHLNLSAVERWLPLRAFPRQLQENKGRWRTRHTPVIWHLAEAAIWTGIGDADAVYGIIKDLSSIGARRVSGYGTVRSWEIREIEPGYHQGHSIDGTSLHRPCSSTCVQHYSLENSYETRCGLRPPYWHHGNQYTVQAPTTTSVEA